jgi:hypothetical protein
MFTQAAFQKSFTRLSTLEAVVWELVESLVDKGALDAADLPGAAAARVELEARADAAREPATLPWPAVAVRVDPPDPKPADPVNCAERLPVCQGVCCAVLSSSSTSSRPSYGSRGPRSSGAGSRISARWPRTSSRGRKRAC